MTTDTPDEPLAERIGALLPKLRAFARFLVRDRTEADDLVQEAVLRALRALDSFTPGTDLQNWLFTIQRNAFYEHQRRRRREARALAAHAQEISLGSAAEVDRSDIRDLDRLLWSLSPLLREALVLVAAQGLTNEQAAAVCGVPVGTMKARVARARRALLQARRNSDATSALLVQEC